MFWNTNKLFGQLNSLTFWRSDIWNGCYEAKIKLSASLSSSWRIWRSICLLPFPASQDCLHPLAGGPIIPLSASTVTSPLMLTLLSVSYKDLCYYPPDNSGYPFISRSLITLAVSFGHMRSHIHRSQGEDMTSLGPSCCLPWTVLLILPQSRPCSPFLICCVVLASGHCRFSSNLQPLSSRQEFHFFVHHCLPSSSEKIKASPILQFQGQ